MQLLAASFRRRAVEFSSGELPDESTRLITVSEAFRSPHCFSIRGHLRNPKVAGQPEVAQGC